MEHLSSGLAHEQHSSWDTGADCSAQNATCHIRAVDLFECLHLPSPMKNSMRVEFMPLSTSVSLLVPRPGLGTQETLVKMAGLQHVLSSSLGIRYDSYFEGK